MLLKSLADFAANALPWLMPTDTTLPNTSQASSLVALHSLNPLADLSYSGTLDSVLSELTQSSLVPNVTRQNNSILALHPPRIIRAFVDYKIDHPHSPHLEGLLQNAVAVALNVYEQPLCAQQSIIKLRDTIAQSSYADILESPLVQEDDRFTRAATNPARSQITAQKLVDVAQDDVLFIALGHGGVAAGMDVYLRYCHLSKSQNSTFYVARLSMTKCNDTQPQLSPNEITYLQKRAHGKSVVIFDEDVASGSTFKTARDYFSNHVFSHTPILFATNWNIQNVTLFSNNSNQSNAISTLSSKPKTGDTLYKNLFNNQPLTTNIKPEPFSASYSPKSLLNNPVDHNSPYNLISSV